MLLKRLVQNVKMMIDHRGRRIREAINNPLRNPRFCRDPVRGIGRRLLYLVLRILRPGKPVLCSYDRGLRFELHLTDLMSAPIFYQGMFEYTEQRFLVSVVRRENTVVDLGANIGLYTLLAADVVGPEGRVVACEPNPWELTKLKRNIKLNGFSHVTTLPLAVSDHNGQAEFIIPPNGLGAFSRMSTNPSQKVGSLLKNRQCERIKVPIIALDTLATRLDLKRIDFLKVDVEGAEESVFRGARRLLSKGLIRIILFECGENYAEFDASLQGIAELFHKYGYVLLHFDRNHRLQRMVDLSPREYENLVAVKRNEEFPLLRRKIW